MLERDSNYIVGVNFIGYLVNLDIYWCSLK